MYGFSCYGTVPYGGLLETEASTFPLTLVLSESDIYNLTLTEA